MLLAADLIEVFPDIAFLPPTTENNRRLVSYLLHSVEEIFAKDDTTVPNLYRGFVCPEWEPWPGVHKFVSTWVEVCTDDPAQYIYGRRGTYCVGINMWHGKSHYVIAATKRTQKQRDSQRRKLYKAENIMHGWVASCRLNSIEDAQAYVNCILHKGWYKELWAKINVIPVQKTNNKFCYVRFRSIFLNDWGLTTYTVLHELAHVLAMYQSQDKEAWASHGTRYCEILLFLVLKMMGKKAYDVLRYHFEVYKVKFTTDQYLTGMAASQQNDGK